VPSAGVPKNKAIQAYVKSLFIDGYLKSESAKVEILNGNAPVSEVYAVSGVLKSLGYNVIKTTPAQTGNDGKTIIKDYTNGKKPYTLKYLENRFNVKSVKGDTSQSGAEIEIVLGANYEFKDNN
jgi:hypothetical protein